ncbi:MAG: hypothetical protein GWO21_01705, partial [Gammaproteobacteria bacterium]|nr:hypothetical protein [Gammaproteobacteria bacterium]
MKIVISGVETLDEVPGIESINDEVELICAKDRTTLESALPGADILIGWNFEARDVPEIWPLAGSLKWIHWCGVAVDTVIFPELSRP